jgi:hypothetical protein
MATRAAAQGRGDPRKNELHGRVRTWQHAMVPVHSKESSLASWQWVQTGAAAPNLNYTRSLRPTTYADVKGR